MRLIDADKMLDMIDLLNDRNYSKQEIVAMINSRSTAYDIDKVVEELEEWSINVTILELHNNELREYEEECKRDVICTENAIEIVKAGGRE